MTLGEKFKTIRETFGFSQAGFATAIGFSRQAVTKWENEMAIPDIYNLEKIVANLGIPIAKFLDEEEPVYVYNIETELSEDVKDGKLSDRDILKKYFNRFFTIYSLEVYGDSGKLKRVLYKYLFKKQSGKNISYYLVTKNDMKFLVNIDKVHLTMNITRIDDDIELEVFEYGEYKFKNTGKIAGLKGRK